MEPAPPVDEDDAADSEAAADKDDDDVRPAPDEVRHLPVAASVARPAAAAAADSLVKVAAPGCFVMGNDRRLL